jgi:outer membrane lipoprotein SlyB
VLVIAGNQARVVPDYTVDPPKPEAPAIPAPVSAEPIAPPPPPAPAFTPIQ